MKRFITKALIKWKNSKNRKPLIIRGARQVGKTFSIKEFGKNYFDHFIMIDMERNPELHQIFEQNFDIKRICSDIELMIGKKIIQGNTLLFIDEIQACPKAIVALRYFYEEFPQLYIIAAGSLLEFSMQNISMPVGRLQFLTLHPLSFIEFLMAVGKESAAKNIIQPPEKLSDSVHEMLLDQLKRYFFIGGMPECVNAYRETNSFRAAFEIQYQICEIYKMDFSKYTPQVNHQCLISVLQSVAQNTGHQIKYSKLADGFSQPTIKRAFQLLMMANVIKKIPSVDPSGFPLGLSESHNIFKSIIVDIGLFQNLVKLPVDIEFTKNELLNIYNGAIAEHFVGQEMAITQNNQLNYWNRMKKSSIAEVDYVANINNQIIPIEVKSGKSGRLKSLHLYLKTYDKTLRGIVFSTRQYSKLPKEKLVFIPIYFTFSATLNDSERQCYWEN